MNIFKVGDKVKLSDKASKEVHKALMEIFGTEYKDKVYTVSDIKFASLMVKGCDKWSFGFGAFEIYKEERDGNMDKFKVGDKVKLSDYVKKQGNNILRYKFGEKYKDMIYEIKEVRAYCITIKGCEEWTFGLDMFEKCESNKEEFKKGDKVILREENLTDYAKKVFRSIYGSEYLRMVYTVNKLYSGDTSRLILNGCDEIAFRQNLFKKYVSKFKVGEKVKIVNDKKYGLEYLLGLNCTDRIYTIQKTDEYHDASIIMYDSERIVLKNEYLEKIEMPQVSHLTEKQRYKTFDAITFEVSPNNIITRCKVINTTTNKETMGRATLRSSDEFDKRYGYVISLCRALEIEESKVKGIIDVLYGESVSKKDIDEIFSKVLDEIFNK